MDLFYYVRLIYCFTKLFYIYYSRGNMAKKDLGLSKIKYFEPKVVGRIALQHITLMYRRVTEQGHDAHGRTFKDYTSKYRERKSGGMKKKDGGRLKGFYGMHTSTQVTPPNFKLRGLTMSGLRRRSYNRNSYKIGWRGEYAAIVDGNESRGRDIVSTIPDKEHNQVVRLFYKSIERQHRKKIKNLKIVVGR